jgi:hypothetical protein
MAPAPLIPDANDSSAISFLPSPCTALAVSPEALKQKAGCAIE